VLIIRYKHQRYKKSKYSENRWFQNSIRNSLRHFSSVSRVQIWIPQLQPYNAFKYNKFIFKATCLDFLTFASYHCGGGYHFKVNLKLFSSYNPANPRVNKYRLWWSSCSDPKIWIHLRYFATLRQASKLHLRVCRSRGKLRRQ